MLRLTLCAAICLFIGACTSDDPNEVVDTDKLSSCFTIAGDMNAGVPLQFTSDCSTNAMTFQWSFGDVGSSTAENPSFTFPNEGTYEVALTVANTNGASDSFSKTVTIAPVPQSAITDHIGDIEEDEVWEAGVHRILGFVNIKDATVTIMPGVVLKFTEGAELNVGTMDYVSSATLIANGTASQGILMTADSDTPYNGFWDNINFGSGDSGNSSLKYCTIEYGGTDNTTDAMIHTFGSASITMENSTVRYSGSQGLDIGEPGFKQFSNNSVLGNDSHVMQIHPNVVQTIGENNVFDTNSSIALLNTSVTVSNAYWKKETCPYSISGNLIVGHTNEAVLTIGPGCLIQFGNFGKLTVGPGATHGKLIAEGTDVMPITFTSMITDPGLNDRWNGLFFMDGNSMESSLKYCTVENTSGTSTNKEAAITINNTAVHINNTTLRNAYRQAIFCDEEGRFGSFENNLIENTNYNGVTMHGNWVHTLGNTTGINALTAVTINTDIITHEAVTWKKQVFPYFVNGKIEVGGDLGTMLTIEAGTTIEMGGGQSIEINPYSPVGGGIIADGTNTDPIIFTSANANPQPGDWSRIQLSNKTLTGTKFNHCIFEYGGKTYDAPLELSFTDIPIITNNTIRNNEDYGIKLQSSNPTLSGNVFSGNGNIDFLITQ